MSFTVRNVLLRQSYILTTRKVRPPTSGMKSGEIDYLKNIVWQGIRQK
jgi:hypothetical protein